MTRPRNQRRHRRAHARPSRPTAPAGLRWRRRASHPRTWALAAAVLCAVLAVRLASLNVTTDHERTQWSQTRRVPQAARTLTAGDPLGAGDVRWVELPLAAVPAAELADPNESGHLSRTIHPREILLADDLSDRPLSPIARSLPRGRQALNIARSPGSVPVEAGERVDLWVPGGARPAAANVEVLASSEETMTVALTPRQVPAVADAAFAGAIAISLRGPGAG